MEPTDGAQHTPAGEPARKRGPRRLSRLLPLALIGGLGFAAVQQMQAGAVLPEGARVPALSIPLGDGGVFELSERPGRVLVLSFWATWCQACKRSAPILSQLHRDGVSVLGVAVDRLEPDAVTERARGLGMDYPIGLSDAALASRFAVRVVPTTYVIAPDGVIVLGRTGVVSGATLRQAVERARGRGATAARSPRTP